MKVKRLIRRIRKISTTISPRLSNRLMYLVLMKKHLRLKDPKSFSDKINYLKLNVFPKDPLVIQCTDKVSVADYVKEKVGEHILVDRYGVWENPEDIEWEKLPESFVLKCNHGCGYNIICSDKTSIDKNKAIKQLKEWLKEDFWKTTCEPHYKHIPKKILCERYLGDEICDYKFFCFDGKPEFFYVSKTLKGDFHTGEFAMFNCDGSFAPFQRSDHKLFEKKPDLPSQLQEMFIIARKLSADFPFVRVDLFVVNDRVLFSELTFTPCAGMMPLSPVEADLWLGKLIDLEKYRK